MIIRCGLVLPEGDSSHLALECYDNLPLLRAPQLSGWIAALLLFSGALGAQEGSIPRDGFTLYYRTAGSGKPMIFLSGGPGLEVDYMKPVTEFFPREYERVFLEQRGTGRSRPAKLTAEHISLRLMVDDLEALRSQLKMDCLLLVGHSWGGMLAMAYASIHPEHVDKLILIASGGPTIDFQRWFGDNIEARLRPEDKEARQFGYLPKSRDAAGRDCAGSAACDCPRLLFRSRKRAGIRSTDSQRDPAPGCKLAPRGRPDEELRSPRRVRQVLRPVLIIQCHQDPIGDKTAEDIHALTRSSAIQYLDRCGHFPWIEQPGENAGRRRRLLES